MIMIDPLPSCSILLLAGGEDNAWAARIKVCWSGKVDR